MRGGVPTVLILLALGCSDAGTGPNSLDRLEIHLAVPRDFYPIGDTVRANVRGVAGDGSIAPVVRRTWRSLNPDRAIIDSGGLIRMLGRGTAVIEVEADGRTARHSIEVDGVLHARSTPVDQVWTANEGPHVIAAELVFASTDTTILTIEPGATLFFRPGTGLFFSDYDYGRLLIPDDGTGRSVRMEADPTEPGRWSGIALYGAIRSEFRNVVMRHCGGETRSGNMIACVTVASSGIDFGKGLEVLLQNVRIEEAAHAGVHLGSNTRFAPGSRDLSVHAESGFLAVLPPSAIPGFPLGGTFSPSSEVLVTSGSVSEDVTWGDVGVGWRLGGEVHVDGATLTIDPGQVIRADPQARIVVGKYDPASLRMGVAGGEVLRIQSTGAGWGGLTISLTAEPSSLERVVLEDCGLDGACVALDGGHADGVGLRVEDVTVMGARSTGFALTAAARFSDDSGNLTVTGGAGVPVSLPPNSVWSLPPGLYVGNADDRILISRAPVTTSQSWIDPGIPYFAVEGLDVDVLWEEPPVLTLEPGVRVQFGPARRFFVNRGALVAVGNGAQPIVFEGDVSAVPAQPASWIGVELGPQFDGTTRFEHVDVRDAGGVDANLGYGTTPGAFRLWHDPGGTFHRTTVRRSAGCALMLLLGEWTDDYTEASFGNVFLDGPEPAVCQRSEP